MVVLWEEACESVTSFGFQLWNHLAGVDIILRADVFAFEEKLQFR